jgi:hypothetical protein
VPVYGTGNRQGGEITVTPCLWTWRGHSCLQRRHSCRRRIFHASVKGRSIRQPSVADQDSEKPPAAFDHRTRSLTIAKGCALEIPRRGVEVSSTPLCGLATLRDHLLPVPSRSSSFTICVIPSFDLIGSPRKLNGVRVLANDFLRQADFFLAKAQRRKDRNHCPRPIPVLSVRYASVNLVNLSGQV